MKMETLGAGRYHALVVLGCGAALPVSRATKSTRRSWTCMQSTRCMWLRRAAFVCLCQHLASVVNEHVVIDASQTGMCSFSRPLWLRWACRISPRSAASSRAVFHFRGSRAGGHRELRFRKAGPSARRVGLATSQGDQAMRADIARNTLGVTGAGVTVGVSRTASTAWVAPRATSVRRPLDVQVIQEELAVTAGQTRGALCCRLSTTSPGAFWLLPRPRAGMASFANISRAQGQRRGRHRRRHRLLRRTMFQDGIIARRSTWWSARVPPTSPRPATTRENPTKASSARARSSRTGRFHRRWVASLGVRRRYRHNFAAAGRKTPVSGLLPRNSTSSSRCNGTRVFLGERGAGSPTMSTSIS